MNHLQSRYWDTMTTALKVCAVCGEPTGIQVAPGVSSFHREGGWALQSMYCSDACKMRAYRARIKAERAAAAATYDMTS
jgi:hypothetical protein